MRIRPLAYTALALVCLAAAGTPAQAGGRPAPRHCVVWISPAGQTGHSSLSAMRCFSTFRSAKRYARGPAPRAFRAATDVTIEASTTISIDYDGANFSGSSLTGSVANSAGCNGFSYSAASMPSGWNDRVSSSHSYAACDVNRHFHDVNFLGAGIVCTCATMGTMTNQTSSERWS
jgi:hypothetical protein